MVNILTAILSPAFLVNNIDVIAFVISVMILVFFDDFVVGKIIFPIADFIKYEFARGIDIVYERKKIKAQTTWARLVRKYSSETLSTVLVVFYCYVGYEILGIYVIAPILERWKSFITIVVIILFLIVNYLVNNPKMRKRFFGFGIYTPEKKQSKESKRQLAEQQQVEASS